MMPAPTGIPPPPFHAPSFHSTVSSINTTSHTYTCTPQACYCTPRCYLRITPPLRSESSFVANAAGRGGSGGGIWVEDGAAAALAGTELVNNTAASSYTHKGAGGGVAVAASARLSMAEGCSLEGNVAGPEVLLLDWGLARGMGCRCSTVHAFSRRLAACAPVVRSPPPFFSSWSLCPCRCCSSMACSCGPWKDPSSAVVSTP